jgi:hypothetical protein
MKVSFTVDCGYSVGAGEQLQHLHLKCVSEGEIEFQHAKSYKVVTTGQVLIAHGT